MPPEMLRDVFGEPASLLNSDKDPEYQYRKLKEAGEPIPSIYLAIGTEDALYPSNQDFRAFLMREDADFRYVEGSGGHNWTFWNEYLDKGLAWVLR